MGVLAVVLAGVVCTALGRRVQHTHQSSRGLSAHDKYADLEKACGQLLPRLFSSSFSPRDVAAAFNPVGIPVRSHLRQGKIRSRSVKALLPDDYVAHELNCVPVFALVFREEGEMYTMDDAALIYTRISDANKMVGNLQEMWRDAKVDVVPFALGDILRKGGMLSRDPRPLPPVELKEGRWHLEEEANKAASGIYAEFLGEVEITLVPSPADVQTASAIRKNTNASTPVKRTGMAGRLQQIPIFHIGAHMVKNEEGEEERNWPFFFCTSDIDILWREIGKGAPMPTVQVTDLAALVDGLRAMEKAPARPIVCAPLDALGYVRTIDEAKKTTGPLKQEDSGDDRLTEEEARSPQANTVGEISR